jgi:hypothetical protein
MKKLIALLSALAIMLPLAACSGGNAKPTDAISTTDANSSTAVDVRPIATTTSEANSGGYDSDDLDARESGPVMSYITLKGDSITLKGNGAKVDGSKITITSAGIYSLSGTLDDGQIIVNTWGKETVKLVLNGANITYSTSAPINVVNAGKVVITLADGSKNSVTDGDAYLFEDTTSDEPNAAIFSKADLTINGGGSLTVNANFNNGITSKDDLKIISGNITVNAANDGLRGRDSIAVRDGAITIKADGDGMQSNNDTDPEKGLILIEGGTFDITAGLDGIQAETSLTISGGNIAISSGGGSPNSSSNASSTGNTWGNWGIQGNPSKKPSAPSAKGLKAVVALTIAGGTVKIDSSDDSIHSNGSIVISGGNMTLTSGDDGIHADATIEISGGDIRIIKSYEGIESAIITINKGNIHLVSSDDGINVVGGVDDSAINGRPGQNQFTSTGSNYLIINGGYLVVDAKGDGLDVNGPITMTGGNVIVNGPTLNDNGALDYSGSFKITGGYLVAAGSSGMAEAPSASSSLYSVLVYFSSPLTAGTIVHIATKDGEEILTFVPTKAYQSIALCSPTLKNGTTYTVYTGGSTTGTATDSLVSGGKYTAGTQISSFTISGMVTYAGTPTGGFFGGIPGGGMGR